MWDWMSLAATVASAAPQVSDTHPPTPSQETPPPGKATVRLHYMTDFQQIQKYINTEDTFQHPRCQQPPAGAPRPSLIRPGRCPW